MLVALGIAVYNADTAIIQDQPILLGDELPLPVIFNVSFKGSSAQKQISEMAALVGPDLLSVGLIDHTNSIVRAFSTVGAFDSLSKAGNDITLVHHPSISDDSRVLSDHEHGPRRRATQKQCDPDYRSHEQIIEALNRVTSRCPAITRLFSIGKSAEGRNLYVLEISDNPGKDEVGEAEVKLVGNMHGDEVVGRELLVHFAEELCDNYYRDDNIRGLVDNTRIFLMPTLNPDGFAMGRRENSQSVDLNRNFPDKFLGDANSIEDRAPETVAMMRWTDSRRFTLAANFHGGALVASYPWDATRIGHPQANSATDDDLLFREISRIYSTTHKTMSRYSSVMSATEGIINGAEWYVVYGSMADWSYHWYNVYEITLEVSKAWCPAFKSMPVFWDHNREALFAFVQQAHQGVSGYVLTSISTTTSTPQPSSSGSQGSSGSESGVVVQTVLQRSPARAVVTITDQAHGITYKADLDTRTGYFHRLLPAGNGQYTVRIVPVDSSRYLTEEYYGVTVEKGKRTWIPAKSTDNDSSSSSSSSSSSNNNKDAASADADASVVGGPQQIHGVLLLRPAPPPTPFPTRSPSDTSSQGGAGDGSGAQGQGQEDSQGKDQEQDILVELVEQAGPVVAIAVAILLCAMHLGRRRDQVVRAAEERRKQLQMRKTMSRDNYNRRVLVQQRCTCGAVSPSSSAESAESSADDADACMCRDCESVRYGRGVGHEGGWCAWLLCGMCGIFRSSNKVADANAGSSRAGTRSARALPLPESGGSAGSGGFDDKQDRQQRAKASDSSAKASKGSERFWWLESDGSNAKTDSGRMTEDLSEYGGEEEDEEEEDAIISESLETLSDSDAKDSLAVRAAEALESEDQYDSEVDASTGHRDRNRSGSGSGRSGSRSEDPWKKDREKIQEEKNMQTNSLLSAALREAKGTSVAGAGVGVAVGGGNPFTNRSRSLRISVNNGNSNNLSDRRGSDVSAAAGVSIKRGVGSADSTSNAFISKFYASGGGELKYASYSAPRRRSPRNRSGPGADYGGFAVTFGGSSSGSGSGGSGSSGSGSGGSGTGGSNPDSTSTGVTYSGSGSGSRDRKAYAAVAKGLDARRREARREQWGSNSSSSSSSASSSARSQSQTSQNSHAHMQMQGQVNSQGQSRPSSTPGGARSSEYAACQRPGTVNGVGAGAGMDSGGFRSRSRSNSGSSSGSRHHSIRLVNGPPVTPESLAAHLTGRRASIRKEATLDM